MLAHLAVMAGHEFSVSVHDLDAAGKSFRFPVRAAWLRGVLEGTDAQAAATDGELDVRLSKSGTDVVVRGALAAELTAPCARCLAPARLRIHEPISALVVPASALAAPDPSDDDAPVGDADVITFDGETVVLDNLVRDELLLGIPMIPLCSEACPGIRPETSPKAESPAATSDVDPRFRPLLGLKRPT